MASLFNKLTGHGDKHTDADKHHDATHTHSASSASTHGAHTVGSTTTTQQTTTTGTAPYGTTGTTTDYTARTGAAYTGAAATTNTGVVGHNTQHVAHTDAAYSQRSGALSGDDAITRSEEQLRVAKERVEVGKAELNKYVTTEHVEQAVAVQKERVVIEREPITAANMGSALSGPEISEAHYETTLSEDRVTAAKEVVPIERIRLAKQVETTTQNVGADLRKEHVDFTHTALTGAEKVEPSHTTGYQQTATTTTTTTGAAGVPHTKY